MEGLRICITVLTGTLFVAIAALAVMTIAFPEPEKFTTTVEKKYHSSFQEDGSLIYETDNISNTRNKTNFFRTVLLIHNESPGHEKMFIRGGLTENNGCAYQHDKSKNRSCSMPVVILPTVHSHHFINSGMLHRSIHHLDWGEQEIDNRDHSSIPLIWTTDDSIDGDKHQNLNKYGSGFWKVDLLIDCSKTTDDWFEFQAIPNVENSVHVYNISQISCSGDLTQRPPFESIYHVAKCGFINIFYWNENQCQINFLEGK